MRLGWLAGHGIPCPAVVAHEPGILVTTTLPGRSGAEVWPADQRPGLADAFADLLRAVHSLPAADCPFDRSLGLTIPAAEAAVGAGHVDLDDLDPGRQGWTAERLLARLHTTRPATEELVVCHGDPTLANVFCDDHGHLTGVIDVGRLGVADRYLDLAIASRSLTSRWHQAYGSRLLRRYGLDRVDLGKIQFYRLLDEFF
jgi:aminoglycoside phosphotransferase